MLIQTLAPHAANQSYLGLILVTSLSACTHQKDEQEITNHGLGVLSQKTKVLPVLGTAPKAPKGPRHAQPLVQLSRRQLAVGALVPCSTEKALKIFLPVFLSFFFFFFSSTFFFFFFLDLL